MREAELKNKDQLVKEGLADLADRAEKDHEVQMARAELYKAAKYSIKLHEMLKGVSEAEGLEGWVQSKITKAADYLSSVYHHLDYQEAQDDMAPIGEATQEATCGCGPDCDQCGGKHTMKEVGQTCKCCNNKVKAVAAEGKGKSNKQKAAIAIAKKEKGYKESLSDKLSENLSQKKSLVEKAKSQAQQKFMGMVYSAKKGEKPASPEVAKVAKDISKKDAKDFAATKHKGLPKKVENLCSDCGYPNWRNVKEEKQKGVDGKVCWKGYKRMGTKKKGGKTVDNCVKM